MTDALTVGPIAARSPSRRSRRHAAALWRSGLLSLLLVAPISARAAEPVITVLKNTLLGGVTGLVMGGALSLVADEDHRDDVVRWGFVIGTFGGFALGVTLAVRGEEGLFYTETAGIRTSSGGAVPRRPAPQTFAPAQPITATRPDGYGLLCSSLTVAPNGR